MLVVPKANLFLEAFAHRPCHCSTPVACSDHAASAEADLPGPAHSDAVGGTDGWHMRTTLTTLPGALAFSAQAL